MPILKYAFKKNWKSINTWVIFTLSILIIIIIAISLKSTAKHDVEIKTPFTYFYNMRFKHILSISIISIFSSIFAGFKGVEIFKTDIEDGTLLVILSKPISRKKIIFEKWLALLSTLSIFAFGLSFVLVGSEIIADISQSKIPNLPFKTFTQNSLFIFIFTFGIFIVTCLVFSSLSIFISIFSSSGAALGATIGIAVLIPTTSMIERFAKQNEYFNQIRIPTRFSPILNFNYDVTNNVEYSNILGNQFSNYKNKINSLSQKFIEEDLIKTNKDANFNSITNYHDSFKYLWFFDLNFITKKIAEFSFLNFGGKYSEYYLKAHWPTHLPLVGSREYYLIPDNSHPFNSLEKTKKTNKHLQTLFSLAKFNFEKSYEAESLILDMDREIQNQLISSTKFNFIKNNIVYDKTENINKLLREKVLVKGNFLKKFFEENYINIDNNFGKKYINNFTTKENLDQTKFYLINFKFFNDFKELVGALFLKNNFQKMNINNNDVKNIIDKFWGLNGKTKTYLNRIEQNLWDNFGIENANLFSREKLVLLLISMQKYWLNSIESIRHINQIYKDNISIASNLYTHSHPFRGNSWPVNDNDEIIAQTYNKEISSKEGRTRINQMINNIDGKKYSLSSPKYRYKLDDNDEIYINDFNALNAIKNAVYNGKIVYVKKREYLNSAISIGVFLGLSILIPFVSYMLLRKRDFR